MKKLQPLPSLLMIASGIVSGVLALPQEAAAQQQGWDTQTNRTLTYVIDVDMYVDQNDPSVYLEHDVRNLIVTIGNGLADLVRTSSIEGSNEHFGPYGFNADGSLTILPDDPTEPDDQKEPPMEADLLLRLFDSVPFDPAVGSSWSFWSHDLSEIPPDQLALRAQSRLTVTGSSYVGPDQQLDFAREGDLQMIDNLAMWAMVGAPPERSPALAATVAALGEEDNLYLFGNQVWEIDAVTQYGQTVSVDFLYVTIPHSWGTYSTISNSIRRQHLTAILVP